MFLGFETWAVSNTFMWMFWHSFFCDLGSAFWDAQGISWDLDFDFSSQYGIVGILAVEQNQWWSSPCQQRQPVMSVLQSSSFCFYPHFCPFCNSSLKKNLNCLMYIWFFFCVSIFCSLKSSRVFEKWVWCQIGCGELQWVDAYWQCDCSGGNSCLCLYSFNF